MFASGIMQKWHFVAQQNKVGLSPNSANCVFFEWLYPPLLPLISSCISLPVACFHFASAVIMLG